MSNVVHEYILPDGRSPYAKWLASLRDRKAQARVMLQVDRIELGLFGDSRPIGAGLSELRIHYGPGYRVYYGKISDNNYLILYGGIKLNQTRDIARAKSWWKEYRKKARHET